jgi:hypothetical protein
MQMLDGMGIQLEHSLASLSALHMKGETTRTTTELLKLAVQNQLYTFCGHLTCRFCNCYRIHDGKLDAKSKFFHGRLGFV